MYRPASSHVKIGKELAGLYIFDVRHEWQQWGRQGLLRVLGRTQVLEGWVCTKCGRRNRIRLADKSQATDPT